MICRSYMPFVTPSRPRSAYPANSAGELYGIELRVAPRRPKQLRRGTRTRAKKMSLTKRHHIVCISVMGKRSPHEATCPRIASGFHQGRAMSAINPISQPPRAPPGLPGHRRNLATSVESAWAGEYARTPIKHEGRERRRENANQLHWGSNK
jgi:hypothetical protein